MELTVDTHKCTGCRICEFACSYHYDVEYSALSSSLMLHRVEKKGYFGLILKREKDLYLARPEGAEIKKPGEKVEGAGASAKPILMRASCNLCEDEDQALCELACPYGVLKRV